jgi:hypothetical protein
MKSIAVRVAFVILVFLVPADARSQPRPYWDPPQRPQPPQIDPAMLERLRQTQLPPIDPATMERIRTMQHVPTFKPPEKKEWDDSWWKWLLIGGGGLGAAGAAAAGRKSTKE